MNETPIYPDVFLSRMQTLLKEEYPDFLKSLDTPAPTSIRLNRNKDIGVFKEEEKIPWCETGRYLAERPSFTFDPSFHAGAYYVQEASSMFLEEVWRQINPEDITVRVLDLCAAPGGKSTHLLSLMNSESLLVSNELIQARNKVLQQNILKWGNANCIVTQNKADDFGALHNYFDVVVIDAPCSGEGLFRKDKNAVDEWSEKNVAMCATRQEDILANAVKCVKPGGYLIYSTCTFESAENDEQIERLTQSGFSVIVSGNLEKYTGIRATRFGYQFFPHRVKGEGFYMAVLQKGEGESGNLFGVNTPSAVKSKSSDLLNDYLPEPTRFTEINRNNIFFAMPVSIAGEFELLEKKLYIRHAGIPLGEYKGKDFLPSAALALSNHLRNDLPAVVLDHADAIIYLRGESPQLKTTDKGWHLARYKQLNLGWIKALGNRANNYYPKEWRILKRDAN